MEEIRQTQIQFDVSVLTCLPEKENVTNVHFAVQGWPITI